MSRIWFRKREDQKREDTRLIKGKGPQNRERIMQKGKRGSEEDSRSYEENALVSQEGKKVKTSKEGSIKQHKRKGKANVI